MRLVMPALLLILAAAARAGESPDFPGDPEAGWVYVQQHCADCHSQDGPRSFKRIAEQPGMTGMALVAWLTASEHRSMPHLILKPEDIRNAVSYILSLQDRPAK